MDEIEQRLRQSVEECFKCYEAWRKDERDSSVREGLMDAVHEIRKVASRLEIELAISERKEMAQRPIPIPPHRDAKGRQQLPGEAMDDDFGNAQPSMNHNNNRPRLGHGGGSGGGGGGHRRQRLGHSGGGPRRDENPIIRDNGEDSAPTSPPASDDNG